MVESGPASAWMELWEAKKGILTPESDLNTYFTSKEIGGKQIRQLPLGKVSFPSGEIVVSDPYAPSEDWSPYFTKVAPGDYETEAAIVKTGGGQEYVAAIKVRFSDAETVRYEEALVGDEDLEAADGDNFFGFGIESGAVCVCDAMCMRIFASFKARYAEALGDRFAGLRESYFARRVEEGSVASEEEAWGLAINWVIPGTDYKMLIVDSTSLEGYYPVYLGFDAEKKLSTLIVHLLSIESLDTAEDAASEGNALSGETTSAGGDDAHEATDHTAAEPFFIMVDDVDETAQSEQAVPARAGTGEETAGAEETVAADGDNPSDSEQITFALGTDRPTQSEAALDGEEAAETDTSEQSDTDDDTAQPKKGHLFEKIGRVFRK